MRIHKILITLCLIGGMIIPITSCDDTVSVTKDPNTMAQRTLWDKFTIVEQRYGPNNGFLYIVYDSDTKVMYYIIDAHYRSGISPIYDSDGSVKIYGEKKEA